MFVAFVIHLNLLNFLHTSVITVICAPTHTQRIMHSTFAILLLLTIASAQLYVNGYIVYRNTRGGSLTNGRGGWRPGFVEDNDSEYLVKRSANQPLFARQPTTFEMLLMNKFMRQSKNVPFVRTDAMAYVDE
jgi:hypothetical protein